jgi:hypothetical protein
MSDIMQNDYMSEPDDQTQKDENILLGQPNGLRLPKNILHGDVNIFLSGEFLYNKILYECRMTSYLDHTDEQLCAMIENLKNSNLNSYRLLELMEDYEKKHQSSHVDVRTLDQYVLINQMRGYKKSYSISFCLNTNIFRNDELLKDISISHIDDEIDKLLCSDSFFEIVYGGTTIACGKFHTDVVLSSLIINCYLSLYHTIEVLVYVLDQKLVHIIENNIQFKRGLCLSYTLMKIKPEKLTSVFPALAKSAELIKNTRVEGYAIYLDVDKISELKIPSLCYFQVLDRNDIFINMSGMGIGYSEYDGKYIFYEHMEDFFKRSRNIKNYSEKLMLNEIDCRKIEYMRNIIDDKNLIDIESIIQLNENKLVSYLYKNKVSDFIKN